LLSFICTKGASQFVAAARNVPTERVNGLCIFYQPNVPTERIFMSETCSIGTFGR